MYTCDMQSLQLIHTDYRKGSEEEVAPSKCYSAMAYDYATNYVYASGFGQDLEDNIFQKIKFVDGKPERVSVILKGQGAGKDYLASAGIGRMYEPGYTSSFEDICLYTVDIVNGDEKYIGKVGIEGGRYKGFCIDKRNNRAIVNILKDEGSYIYSIDLTTLQSTCLYRLKDDVWFGELFTMEDPTENVLPAACTISSTESPISINQGEYTGTVTATAPKKLLGGEQGTGVLSLKVIANGEIVGQCAAEWGKRTSVDVDFSDIGSGWYEISVLASNEAGDGPSTKLADNLFVGYDTPKPTDPSLVYHDNLLELIWASVSESANGGYIVPDNITYTVTDTDVNVMAEGLKDCHWQTDVDIAKLYKGYRFAVTAICDGVSSAPAMSNEVSERCWIPTHKSDLGGTDSFDEWTITAKTPNFCTWEQYTSNNNQILISAQEDINGFYIPREADDLAATPPVMVRAGTTYRVKCHYNSYLGDLTFKILTGDSPKPLRMTNVLFSHTTDGYDEYKGGMKGDASEEFTADKDGYIYLGFNVNGRICTFYVGDIIVEEVLDPAVPGKGSIEAFCNSNGELNAKVTVKFPTLTVGGSGLQNITRADVLRGSTVIKSIENPDPGATSTFIDKPESEGYARYYLVCYNEAGRGEVAATEESIHLSGVESIEDAPDNLKVFASDGSISIMGADSLEVTVCRVDGSLLWDGIGADNMNIDAAPGIYLVRTGRHASKVIVR